MLITENVASAKSDKRANVDDPKVHRARILVAEDNPDLRRLLVAALADSCEVEEAENGYQLLEHATGDPKPDLIISDIRMPGLSGLEVLAGLRGPYRPDGWRTPAILITAFGDRETHAAAEQLSAVIFDKPFDLDELRNRALGLLGPAQFMFPGGRRESVECAACGAHVAALPASTANDVWFCASCQERSHLGDFPEVYVELGGGD